jgi:Tfp pilus assembly protein PilE
MIRLSESGMTLVELMIIGASMCVMALGFANMVKNQNDAQNAIRERAERTNIEAATRGSAASVAAIQRSLHVRDP